MLHAHQLDELRRDAERLAMLQAETEVRVHRLERSMAVSSEILGRVEEQLREVAGGVRSLNETRSSWTGSGRVLMVVISALIGAIGAVAGALAQSALGG